MLRERIEECIARAGLHYPWWVPLTSVVGQLVCVGIALGLRDACRPLDPLLLTVVLVGAAPVVQFGFRTFLPWYVESAGPVVAAAWLLAVPVVSDSTIDPAASLLALVTASTVARDGVRPGAFVGTVSAAVLVGLEIGQGVPGFAFHFLDVILGFVVGGMLLWQTRALAAEREARAVAWAQATTAERERIAREIHDLVAHSLSVTLLHITGARHALRDVADGSADAVGEVDSALADAEQVGRTAMADIRRTVSSMADGAEGSRRPLPGAADIAGLARQTRLAGLDVQYDESGDVSALPAPAGLGLYRIAQESLANVAKHAPGCAARMRLAVARGGARLTVSNRLDGAPRRTTDGAGGSGQGSGLAGMHARAEQLGAALTAGPAGADWVVDVRLGPAARAAALDLPRGHTMPLSGRTPEVAG